MGQLLGDTFMRRFAFTAALALALAAGAPVLAQVAPSELARSVHIPFEEFTLDNGLRVVVHTDRKAPVVALHAWYNVGSKDEPQGRTGFAHLFEHIGLFNPTENLPGGLMEPLRAMGATDWNGTTCSTAPTSSRPCRPRRWSRRSTWRATAWAICWGP